MGFVFAALFLWLARPSWRTMAASLALVLPGLWLRGYASGYVRKDAELATTGPYAHTRNPLYLGSMLIAFGFAAAAASWVILALLAGLFAAIYIPTILSEEAYLREHFAGYEAYARAVPRLLPRGAGAAKEWRRTRRFWRAPGFRRRVIFRRSFICATASTIRLWVRGPSIWRWR